MYEADTAHYKFWVRHHREEDLLYNGMIRLPNYLSSGLIFELGSHALNLNSSCTISTVEVDFRGFQALEANGSYR